MMWLVYCSIAASKSIGIPVAYLFFAERRMEGSRVVDARASIENNLRSI
jgi:hypothetical protein